MTDERHNSTRRSIISRRRGKRERPRIEISAGGLVYRRTSEGVDFAMVRDSYGKWTFPKGHVRRGEAYRAAAKREVAEETGIENVRYRADLGRIDIWFRDRYVHKGRLIHKFIYYYLLEAPEGVQIRVPKSKETGENILEVAWVPIDVVAKQSSYRDMRPIMKKAFGYLRKRQILS